MGKSRLFHFTPGEKNVKIEAGCGNRQVWHPAASAIANEKREQGGKKEWQEK
jgi:hypothetical protein